MKFNVLSMEKKPVRQIELPKQFDEPVREDLIKRAVLAIHNNTRQPYGAKPDAGKRASAKLSRRRRDYKGSYGLGISRVPRKILSKHGTRMNWVGAFAPGTVKGRRAHPPKAARIWSVKMNKKERRKAIRSALAATMSTKYIQKRGHRIPKEFPFILEDHFEQLEKTQQVEEALAKLGFEEELARISIKNIRAGKGKMRGRKYKIKKGPLFVVSRSCALVKSAQNMTGVEVMNVENLNANLLAPGCMPGRLTLFTESAITRIGKEGLFMNDYQRIKAEPQVKAAAKEAKPQKTADAKKAEKKTAKPKTEKKPAKVMDK